MTALAQGRSHDELVAWLANKLQAARWRVDREPRVGRLEPDLVAVGPDGMSYVIEVQAGEHPAHLGSIGQMEAYATAFEEQRGVRPRPVLLVAGEVSEAVRDIARDVGVVLIGGVSVPSTALATRLLAALTAPASSTGVGLQGTPKRNVAVDRVGRDPDSVADPDSRPAAREASTPSGDEPLDDLSQDRLGREGFVKLLVEEIRSAPASGFVIGVTGSWGSGKTSVINMAVSSLDEEPGYRVLRFNPWLFSGTPQLVEHFFTELAAQLREAGRRRKGERLTNLGSTVERYGNLLDPLRFAPGVDTAAKVSRFAGGALRSAGKGPTSVRAEKETLDKLLNEHDERLIVVIDDIDRLEEGEIRDVMRLVRLVGDFPNVVYILAFATDVVARALGNRQLDLERATSDGHTYLEKIVQVTHAVPSIDREAMSALVLRRLEETLRDVAYEIEVEHWSAVYSAIRGYFRTMRDVLRYCNAVRAPAEHLIADIDIADILGLEALRLFEPAVWERLSSLARGLTSTYDSYILDSERTADEERIKVLIEDARDQKAVNELLPVLFPAVARIFRGSMFGSDFQADWRRRGRVAHLDVLRIYLSRHVASDQASRADARAAVEAMTDPEVLRRHLRKMEDERLPALLSRIEDYAEELALECAIAIPVFYEQLPRLPRRAPGLFDIGPEIRISRVVYRILKGHTPAAVAAAVEPVIADLPWISDQISVLRTMGWRSERAERLVDEALLDQWARAAADAARARPAERLEGEYDIGSVITTMREFHGQDAINAWARERISHTPFFLQLLTTYMGEVRSSAGRFTQLMWDRLSELLGEDLLVATIEHLPSEEGWRDGLTEDEREMLSQARRFASDPEEARRVIKEYRQQYR